MRDRMLLRAARTAARTMMLVALVAILAGRPSLTAAPPTTLEMVTR
jgi:hypothetical protein